MWCTLPVVFAALFTVSAAGGCVRRVSLGIGDDGGHYCVCNATDCDSTPHIKRPLNPRMYQVVSSSKSGLRYSLSKGTFKPLRRFHKNGEIQGKIIVNHAKRYQRIFGFGGAVTDSTGMNIKSLSDPVADKLMRAYFGPDGSEYNFIRAPLGGTDFSPRPYSYAMVENDATLSHFELAEEDYVYKIPYIKQAQELSTREVLLVTAPWTASPWMKTVHTWDNNGKLRKEYYHLWAQYFARYLEAYRNEGLEFWATSPQNEPMIYTYTNTSINGMAWTPEELLDFTVNDLSPVLKDSGFDNVRILVADDNRPVFPRLPRTILANATARSLVYATAVHWYSDKTVPPDVLDVLKEEFPEKPLLYTEACSGVFAERRVILGSWKRGEDYANNIIETMNHWVSSWIDWNMALDVEGGPTWIGNNVDSPIIVNATADEFYKQPMYYALGHFSKYVIPGSIRIGTLSQIGDKIKHTAFIRPDGGTVVVVLNTESNPHDILIEDTRKGGSKIYVPEKSLHTIVYW